MLGQIPRKRPVLSNVLLWLCPLPCPVLLRQLSAAQDQVTTLQALVQQLMEKQQALEQQQADVDRTTRLLQGAWL